MQFKFCPWDGYRFNETDVQCFICKKPKYNLQSPEVERKEKKWQKILYEKQPYDDNYIDETFLSSVVKQDIASGPDYRQLINKTSDLIFSLNALVLHLILYVYMQHKIAETTTVLYIHMGLTLAGFTAYACTVQVSSYHSILSNAKSMAIYISILLLFAPTLQTINQTYADDTIYILSSATILFYLFTKDYDYESQSSLQNWQVDKSNWSSLLFSSLLASRLKEELQVFIMIYSSQLLFIFAQFVKRPFKEQAPRYFNYINVTMCFILGIALISLSYFVALLYIGLVFFISFVSPLQLIWLYQYKNIIQGPWDLPNVKQYD